MASSASIAISAKRQDNKSDSEDINLFSYSSLKGHNAASIERMVAPLPESPSSLSSPSPSLRFPPPRPDGYNREETTKIKEPFLKKKYSMSDAEDEEEESEELRSILYKQRTFVPSRQGSGSGSQSQRLIRQYPSMHRRSDDDNNLKEHADLVSKLEKTEPNKPSRTVSWADLNPESMDFPPYILNPEGIFYLNFFYVTIVLAIIGSLVEPYNIAYLDCESIFTSTNIAMYIVDLVFIADVVISFFVAVFKRGDWLLELPDIAKSYLTSSFTYDMMEALPWDLIAKLFWRPHGLAALKCTSLGFIRLLRLKRLFKFFWDVGVDLKFDYFTTSVVKFSALIIFSAHWAATVFYLLARLRDFDDETWVGRDEPDLPNRTPWFAYTTSIYWAMTTLSTAGYGDFSAHTFEERWWTSLFMLSNLGLTAYVLGNMTVLLTKADGQTAAYRDRLTAMNRYMKAHRISSDVQSQLRAHLKLHFETSEVRDDILMQCPSTIRMRIMKQVYSRWVNMPYLFVNTSQVFRDQLATHMHVDFFMPNTNIITMGDTVNELYILASPNSVCEAIVNSTAELSEESRFEFGQGQVLGEVAFICEMTSMWTLRSLTPCRMLVLERDDYETLAKNHPEDARTVVRNLLEESTKVMIRNRRTPGMLDVSTLIHQEIKAYIDKQDQETMMNLCYAAKRGDKLEVFRLTAGGFDLSQTDYDGRTALHLAAAYGQDNVVDFLLNKGAPINTRDSFWRTPLQEAVTASHWSTAEILRSRGGELKLRNEGTHMCRLAYQGHVSELEHLIHYGANPDASDYDGRTALHIAAAEGHVGIVKVLIKCGADVNSMDRWKTTPFDEAVRCNNLDAQHILKQHNAKGGHSKSHIRPL